MWLLSTAGQKTQAQSHDMQSRIDVLHGGRPVATLSPVAGQVTAEASRPVMRNLTCTLEDPTGELSGGDIGDLISPYDCELAVFRGVRVPSPQEAMTSEVVTAGLGLQPLGTSALGGVQVITRLVTAWETEWVPFGVYQLTGRGVPGDGSITVAGQDRAIKYQGGMTGSLAVPGNTPVETAIQRLLATRNAALTMASWKTGFTCGPLLFGPDVDVWDEAQKLAQSVGGWLYHDRTGALVFAPALPTSARPVRRWAEGDGLLIDVDRKEDSDTVHNVVVVQSEKTGNGGIIQAVAEDLNPNSPTYSRGRYGRRVADPIVNPHISSLAQAQQVAATALVRELGRSETAQLTASPDLSLDPQDVVTVNRPRSGLYERGMTIDSITMPLVASDPMTVQMRRSIIAQDGRVLDAAATVTTS